MDGLSRNRTAEHIATIESWMRQIIGDGGIDRYDDLHIDRIDSAWQDRNLWFAGALLAFDLAVTIRDRNSYPFSLALGFSLQASRQPRGTNFKTRADLEDQLGQTPPSLYLFRPEREPWLQKEDELERNVFNVTVQKISPLLFKMPVRVKACYYMEFKYESSSDYSRSVLVAG